MNKAEALRQLGLATILATTIDICSAQQTTQNNSQLEEVVVTARRVAESLSKIPVAVSALSSAELAARSISSEADLQAAVPGLTVRATEQQNQLNYSIRGESLDAFSGASPGVLPYIDEIQVNTASGESDQLI